VFRQAPEGNGKCPSSTITQVRGHAEDHEQRSCSRKPGPYNFTIFEGTSEIQRMLIGRALTGLDVR
jgi:hypothetical protein